MTNEDEVCVPSLSSILISVIPIFFSQFQAHVPDVPLGAVAKIANARTAHVKDAKNEGIFPLK